MRLPLGSVVNEEPSVNRIITTLARHPGMAVPEKLAEPSLSAGRNGPSNTGKQPSYIADHRQRSRFIDGGAAGAGYRCWSLSSSAPLAGTQPLARELLDRFGDFNCVITALAARLRDVKASR